MTCKRCIHWDTCVKDGKTRYYGEEIANNKVEESCTWFYIKPALGVWNYYSTTMMECSRCERHVPRHKYEFCPHCGSKMIPKVQMKEDTEESWEQLTFNT